MDCFREFTAPDLAGLPEYLESVQSAFCPFLEPASSREMVRYSVYNVPEGSELSVEEAIFYLGLLHTEMLRSARVKAPVQRRVFACENLIFRFPGEAEANGKQLFAWPHWLLKSNYTAAGVLFGKFWLGEQVDSRAGKPVPPPPYHLMSIRSAVKPRDPSFFTKAPELLDSLLSAQDDGQRVFETLELGSEFYELLEGGFVRTSTTLSAAIAIKHQTNLFQRLLEEARKERS